MFNEIAKIYFFLRGRAEGKRVGESVGGYKKQFSRLDRYEFLNACLVKFIGGLDLRRDAGIAWGE